MRLQLAFAGVPGRRCDDGWTASQPGIQARRIVVLTFGVDLQVRRARLENPTPLNPTWRHRWSAPKRHARSGGQVAAWIAASDMPPLARAT